MAPALHCEQEISIGNVIGDNIITITLVFGLVALIRSFQVSLSEILSTLRASHRKNTRSATHILATYPLFFSVREIPKEVLFLGLLEICATVSVFLFSAIAHVPSQLGYLPPVGVLLGGFYSAFGLFTQQKWSLKIILAKSALVISMSLFLLNYLEQPGNVASSDSIYYLAFVAVEIIIVVLTLRRPLKGFLGIKEAARISFPVMIGGLLCIFSGILLIILQITQNLNNEFNMFNVMNNTTILCGLTVMMGGVFILLRIYVLSNLGALMSIIFGLLPPSQPNALNISAFHAFDLISNGTCSFGPYTYWVAGLVGSLPIVGGAIALVSMRKILE